MPRSKKKIIKTDLRSQKLFTPNFLFLSFFKCFNSVVRSRALKFRFRYNLASVRNKLVFFNKTLISQQIIIIKILNKITSADKLFKRITNRFFDRTI